MVPWTPSWPATVMTGLVHGVCLTRYAPHWYLVWVPCSRQHLGVARQVALGFLLDPGGGVGGEMEPREMTSLVQEHTAKKWRKQIQIQACAFSPRVCVCTLDS